MSKVKNWFLQNFWTGYSMGEKLFMAFAIATQIVVFCITPDTPLNIVAGIAGCISVILTAKGRWMMYPIGFIQNFTYTVLAFQNFFYGEVIEQVFYVVTMIWGMFAWAKNMNTNEDGTQDVKTRKFGIAEWVCSVIATVIATYLFGRVLVYLGAAQPYTDAATNVMAVFAQIMMVKRYREQWVWWLLIDLFCIKMWWVAGNWSMVAMYVVWTANCIYGWWNWSKLNKSQNEVTVNA